MGKVNNHTMKNCKLFFEPIWWESKNKKSTPEIVVGDFFHLIFMVHLSWGWSKIWWFLLQEVVGDFQHIYIYIYSLFHQRKPQGLKHLDISLHPSDRFQHQVACPEREDGSRTKRRQWIEPSHALPKKFEKKCSFLCVKHEATSWV